MIHSVLVHMVFMQRTEDTLFCIFHLMMHFGLVHMVFMQRTEGTIKWTPHLMIHFVLVHMVFMQRTEGIIKWRSFIRNKELLNSILYKNDLHLMIPSVLCMKTMCTSTK
jgi:hypothetical protein